MFMLRSTHRSYVAYLLKEQGRLLAEVRNTWADIVEARNQELARIRGDLFVANNEIAQLKGELVAAHHAANRPSTRARKLPPQEGNSDV